MCEKVMHGENGENSHECNLCNLKHHLYDNNNENVKALWKEQHKEQY